MKQKFRNAFLLITLFGLIILSCKKESPRSEPNLTDSPTLKRVIDWLDIQKQKFKDKADQKTIATIEEDLMGSQLSTEILNDKEKLIIIPLKEEFKTINITNQLSFKSLVIREREDYGFTIGSIIEIIPKKQNYDKVPSNLISKIYNDQNNDLNGIFSALTLTNKSLYEKEFKDGKLASLSYLYKKKKNSRSGRESTSQKINDCIDWYWVTYVDGVIVNEQYVFTTCDGIVPCRTYRTFESNTVLRIECGGGGGSNDLMSTEVSSSSTEDDPDDAGTGRAPEIYYAHTATLQILNGEVVNVIRYPVTATPMISNYINQHNRNTTRTLTLFGQTGSWIPFSTTSGQINWFCYVFGHYVYSDGGTYSYQWDHTHSRIY
jgi:hypothetical protein